MEFDLAPLPSTTNVFFVYNTLMTSVTLSSSFRKTLKWNSPDQDNWDIVVVTCCCALHLCSWCITRPLGTIRAPTPLHWTITRPWRPPNIILWSSWEHFWKRFLIRTRDQRGNEHRSGTTDNGCSKLVERCRYVAGGMEFDLAPLPSTTDVIFVYNTPLFKNYILKGFC